MGGAIARIGGGRAHFDGAYSADEQALFPAFASGRGDASLAALGQETSIMRLPRSSIGTAFATALLCTGPIGCTTPAPPKPATMSAADAQALYLRRYERYAKGESGAGLDAYDTLAPLGGAARWRPLPAERPSATLAPALAEARAYAAAANSSAFLVWHDGALIEQSYFGTTHQDSEIVSKSLAKPLGVLAVGRAIAKGRIASLDQPMADFITEWRGTPHAAITIREVLGMRSGLLPQGPAPGADNVLNRAYLSPYHDRVLVEEYPLVVSPGSRYDYSNANGDLVAPLIERATGVPYETWLAREVLAPIGARGGRIWMNRPGGTPHSGCCALIPADSYLRLGILLAQDGVWQGHRLLPEGFVTAMTTPSAQNPHAGLGVYLGSPYTQWRGPGNPESSVGRAYHSAPYLAPDLFLFDGNSNQVVYIVPSRRLVILRTGERPPATPVWDNARLPNIVLGALGTR
jgi:CubicO group peptidase (beta-lactamase class C family)